MNPVRVIEAKRDGRELDPEDIRAFLLGFLEGTVEEPQVAAFLMAVYYHGMTPAELGALVEVMLHSGAVLELDHLPAARIDKHSTGGVGDKVSLPLAPLVAEAGIYVPMMSGRGLGHTGGTLDKLEAIPGFRTDLALPRFMEVLEAERMAMIGQTAEIAPLDRRLYALRSVTGTVPSIPLIAASIMSKKLAEGLTGLVLDVKTGSGAFLADLDASRELARTMVALGRERGLPVVARLTAMDRPLGQAVGNALEVAESLACLRGEGPDDLRTVVLALAGEMLAMGGAAPDADVGAEQAGALLDSGLPLERFRRMVEAQGGDAAVVDDPGRLPKAPVVREFLAPRRGRVAAVLPRPIGVGVVEMGGGRVRLADTIDPSVGVDALVAPGTPVDAGDLLARVHARTESDARRMLAVLEAAVLLDDGDPQRPLPLLGERISAG
ncbi:MAG: thymidine phosphorylase [Gemmatimonadales bacterium]|nr:MAG: thymidine phosphorylase [Gemmatimonadales bacterium]